jgi:hypothetical protein
VWVRHSDGSFDDDARVAKIEELRRLRDEFGADVQDEIDGLVASVIKDRQLFWELFRGVPDPEPQKWLPAGVVRDDPHTDAARRERFRASPVRRFDCASGRFTDP